MLMVIFGAKASHDSYASNLAVRRSAWDLEPLSSYVRRFPQVAVARDQLVHGTPELMTRAIEEVRSAMQDAILEGIAGRRPVEAALGRAQTEANEAIAKTSVGGIDDRSD